MDGVFSLSSFLPARDDALLDLWEGVSTFTLVLSSSEYLAGVRGVLLRRGEGAFSSKSPTSDLLTDSLLSADVLEPVNC